VRNVPLGQTLIERAVERRLVRGPAGGPAVDAPFVRHL